MLGIKGVKKEDLIAVAEELELPILPNYKITDLKELISKSSDYENDPEFVKDMLETSISDRRKREEDAYGLQKLKLENETKLELARIKSNEVQTRNSSPTPDLSFESERPLEDMIRSVRTLTIPVPERPEAWNLFFTSLERAFEIKSISENEKKVEILLNLLGGKAANLLIYIKSEEMRNYDAVKSIVLREFEPTAETCLENFRKSRRFPNENHVQFASRLRATWDHYCKLRKVENFEDLNELIVADKLLQTLDNETAAHIKIRQGENWFKPIDLAKESDVYYTSKGKFGSYRESAAPEQKHYERYAAPSSPRHNLRFEARHERREAYNTSGSNRAKECYICGLTTHLARNCSERRNNANLSNPNRNRSATPEQEYRSDVLIAKVISHNLPNSKTGIKIKDVVQPLEFTGINVNGLDVECIVDSGTQIPVLHPKDVPNSKEDCGTLILRSAFGEETRARLTKVFMSVNKNRCNSLRISAEVIVAVTDKLKGPCLLPTNVYKMLEEKHNMLLNLTESVHMKTEVSETGDQEIIKHELFNDLAKSENLGLQELFSGEDGNNKLWLANVEVKSAEINKGMLCSEESEAEKLKKEQMECDDLKTVRLNLNRKEGDFLLTDGTTFHNDKILGETVSQLLSPAKRRKKILENAHEPVFHAHMGIKKRKENIRYNSY